MTAIESMEAEPLTSFAATTIENRKRVGSMSTLGGNHEHPKSSSTANRHPSTVEVDLDECSLKVQISCRLRRRNELFDLRRRLADYSFLVAVLGVLLMVGENEMTPMLEASHYKVKTLNFYNCMKNIKHNLSSKSNIAL